MLNAELTAFLKRQIVVFDGAMGTELYRRHIFTNRCYEDICRADPGLVTDSHLAYLKAGADVITTNSYGANCLALAQHGLAPSTDDINRAAAKLACEARDSRNWGRDILVAGSVGPITNPRTGAQQRIWAYVQQAKALLEGGADFIIFETFPSLDAANEARAAMAELPPNTAFVISHSMPDDDFETAVRARLAYPAEDRLPVPAANGFNCGIGPQRMLHIVEQAVRFSNLPIIVQPNAGSPTSVDNRMLYLCDPEYLATYAVRYATLGANAIGGCCGTTPDHIRELANSVKPMGRAKDIPTITVADHADERVPEKPLAERSRFGAKLAAHEWVTTVEMTPPRSWDLTKTIEKARICKDAGIDVLNLPDGPRASPRLSPLITAIKIQEQAGIETVLHVCCRDLSLIALQAQLLGCAAAGVNNLLFITGDPPKIGNYSFSSGVFDTDAIGLANLQRNLNQGIDAGGAKIAPPTAACYGCGADPNALDFEREVRRVHEKVAAGAAFITTQPVFEVKAFERFINAIQDLHIPVIAGVWPMASLRNALFMKNEVPGVIVPDWIITRMSQASDSAGQLAIGIDIARQTLAELRPMVAGVQVSAPLGNVNTAISVLA